MKRQSRASTKVIQPQTKTYIIYWWFNAIKGFQRTNFAINQPCFSSRVAGVQRALRLQESNGHHRPFRRWMRDITWKHDSWHWVFNDCCLRMFMMDINSWLLIWPTVVENLPAMARWVNMNQPQPTNNWVGVAIGNAPRWFASCRSGEHGSHVLPPEAWSNVWTWLMALLRCWIWQWVKQLTN